MKKNGERFWVYDLKGRKVGEMRVEGQREIWPSKVHGWTHTLDCTVHPYVNQPLEDNLAFAKSLNKQNILVPIRD